MSQFKKNCTTCGKEIQLSNDSGKWRPLNLDNSPHRCLPGDRYQSQGQENTGTKNVSNGNGMISVPMSDLKKMLEFIEGVESIKHRLGVALGVEK